MNRLNEEMIKNKISIKQAVLLRFGIICILVISLMSFVWSSLSQVQQTQAEVAQLQQIKEDLDAAIIAHYQWTANLLTHINTGNQFTGTLDPTACTFGKFINGNFVGSPVYIQAMASAVTSTHTMIHQLGSTITSMESDQILEKLEIYTSQVQPNINQLISIIESTEMDLEADMLAANEGLSQFTTRAIIIYVVVIAMIQILIFTTYFYIRKEILVPIGCLEEETRKLAHGQLNLNFNCDAKTREISMLAYSLNVSLEEVNRIVSDIEDTVDSMSNKDFSIYPSMTYTGDFKAVELAMGKLIDVIRDMMTDIKMSTNQVSAGSEQVSLGAKALADGTMEQSTSVEQLCTIVDMVAEKVHETASNATQADKLGQVAMGVVEKSTSEMSQLMDAIKEIQESSTYIEKIIQTIDDIAFQTNILALNAAVEAARAGTAGKGFAVVADEVRNLAQKSAEAAQNTNTLIESSLTAISKGTELAVHTNDTFKEIVTNTEEVLAVVSKIIDASDTQLDSIDQISESVTQISSVVQINSATSEESAAASYELSNQANRMRNLIEEFKLS